MKKNIYKKHKDIVATSVVKTKMNEEKIKHVQNCFSDNGVIREWVEKQKIKDELSTIFQLAAYGLSQLRNNFKGNKK